MTTIDVVAVDRRIEERLDESVEVLRRLCRVPSVAAQNRGLGECADLLGEILVRDGFEVHVLPTGGAPVVYAEAPGRRDDRTILFYNHYDVQPAEPLELWECEPFDVTEREGRLIGRGVGDDKGHIVCRLAALRALRDVAGQFPCRVKFVVEGEEEIGSVNLARFVEEHRELLRADGCLWEFGGVDYDGRPEIYLGMRGICYVQLHARTASVDAHSGLAGSLLPNAAWRLVWALGTLKGEDERIRIPGFYDDVVPPSPRDRELLAAEPSREAELRRSYGVERFLLDATGIELRRRAVFEPTCTICGLSSGYEGAGAKTVLPAEAFAKVDFRLVPNQDPADIVAKLRRHLEQSGFGDIEVTQLNGEHPARVDPDDPFVRLCIEAAREVYGQEPVVHPLSGGSGPMHPFVHTLGVPIGFSGIGHPEGCAHAPNENVRLADLALGIKHTARILARFAAG